MKAVTKALPVKKFPHKQLWLGVFAADAGHSLAPLRWRHDVGHCLAPSGTNAGYTSTRYPHLYVHDVSCRRTMIIAPRNRPHPAPASTRDTGIRFPGPVPAPASAAPRCQPTGQPPVPDGRTGAGHRAGPAPAASAPWRRAHRSRPPMTSVHAAAAAPVSWSIGSTVSSRTAYAARYADPSRLLRSATASSSR